MNLKHLFELQAKLDERIYKEHPVQEGEDRLAKKILALKVELGELANELPEVFKFWSNKKNNYKKALEELVDCLHFFLSIGNDLWISQDTDFNKSNPRDVMTLFALINRYVAELWWEVHDNTDGVLAKYYFGFQHYLRLGEMLGFTWDQVEQAYLAKNKINHQRQESGY